MSQVIKPREARKQLAQLTEAVMTLPSNNGTILIYPPTGKGGVTINTNDYKCLGAHRYLNDALIEFYLKYVLNADGIPDGGTMRGDVRIQYVFLQSFNRQDHAWSE